MLIPEGLIEFIPENSALIDHLNNSLLPGWTGELTPAAVAAALPEAHRAAFASLPAAVQAQLLFDRDPHGNVSVSAIETEKFLIAGARAELQARASKAKFAPICHFFGYEGRCAAPSAFDTSYCYGLGAVAAVLLGAGVTGYMACLRGLAATPDCWRPGGLPLTCLMNVERRHGKAVPVIMKQLVDLRGRPFLRLAASRAAWAAGDAYQQPGPVQLVESADPAARAVVYQSNMTLQEEQGAQ